MLKLANFSLVPVLEIVLSLCSLSHVSEHYILFRYIEGLHSDSRSISNWDRQLKASQENIEPPDMTRLPAHWLGNGVGNHGNILNALWTLRDFMFRDALGISKLV